MADEHLIKVSEIDEITFERDQTRSLGNLRALKSQDSLGCYVLLDQGEVVGYSFSKTMGCEGYLGPIGLHPTHQGQGYGRWLIKKSLDYLRQNCQIVGLEVRPEVGSNIGFYYKMGFITGFPSILLKFPSKMHKNDSSAEVISINDLSPSEQNELLKEIEIETKKHWGCVNYNDDLVLTRNLGGEIIVLLEEGYPKGYLSYCEEFLPFVWGLLMVEKEKKKKLLNLLQKFHETCYKKDIIIQINTRYSKITNLLIENGFRVHRSVNRMLLKGYEGDHLLESGDIIMRGWRS